MDSFLAAPYCLIGAFLFLLAGPTVLPIGAMLAIRLLDAAEERAREKAQRLWAERFRAIMEKEVNTHSPLLPWDWSVCQGYDLAKRGADKTIWTDADPDTDLRLRP